MADRPAGVARRSSSRNATANPLPLPAWLLFWAETPGAFMTIKAIIMRSFFIRGAYGEVINRPSRFGGPSEFFRSSDAQNHKSDLIHQLHIVPLFRGFGAWYTAGSGGGIERRSASVIISS